MHEHDTDHDRTIGRIYSRREAMVRTARLGAAWAASAYLLGRVPGVSAEPTTIPREPLVASPAMTEGPFFVDEKLNRSDLTADTQRPAVIQAAPLSLTIAVYKLEADTYTPMPDVQVDVWHCDALGFYSDEDHPMNHEDTSGQTWLRGFQRSDADGLVHFQTIVPGWYRGRTPHIHFKVRPTPAEGEAQKEFTSQLFFNHDELAPIYGQGVYAPHGQPDQTNTTDNVYGGRLADGSPVGDQMLLELVKQDDTPGYMTQLPILLTDEGLSRPRGQRPGGPPNGDRPPRGQRPDGPPRD